MRSIIAQLLSAFIILAATTLAPAQDGPSNAATIEWLTDKLQGYVAPFASGSVTGSFTTQKFHIDERGLLTVRSVFQADTSSWAHTQSAYLRNLSPNVKMITHSVSGLHYVVLEATKKGTISSTEEHTGDDFAPRASKDSISIILSDEELANRVIKAFKHLIKVSGGAEEPF